jgi:hypothetical protein
MLAYSNKKKIERGHDVAPIIRKVQIINNRGAVHFGNRYNLASFSVSKTRNGSGGNSTAVILNGRRIRESPTVAPLIQEEISIDVAAEAGFPQE